VDRYSFDAEHFQLLLPCRFIPAHLEQQNQHQQRNPTLSRKPGQVHAHDASATEA
jgi:hypothetical protein